MLCQTTCVLKQSNQSFALVETYFFDVSMSSSLSIWKRYSALPAIVTWLRAMRICCFWSCNPHNQKFFHLKSQRILLYYSMLIASAQVQSMPCGIPCFSSLLSLGGQKHGFYFVLLGVCLILNSFKDSSWVFALAASA